ncbi:uncharacterized protein LOC113072103 isoform X1 [Carassius auratus]|uniref:Uncharacterized protein LOC113072103 isoform X1 n=1 Tax=Carassius auratus TaxID=7957 RepID=A0A6P6MXG7_CARAU|nr:uncharacterized protein LOC113072103 isoform X1 [Carassius auratus]
MGNLKISELLLFAIAALHCGTSEDFIMGNCNDTIRLPCEATDRTKMYRYIMWYKTESPIIKRKNQEYTYYSNVTSFSLGLDEALVLHNVQSSDSGEYKCYLAAEVGGRNDQSSIRLNISECLNVSTVKPITTMIPAESCPAVAELTVPWAVIGFSLISLSKVIFCIITVGVSIISVPISQSKGPQRFLGNKLHCIFHTNIKQIKLVLGHLIFRSF